MNRIILIGNGFDLAHGLKTRYEDFIYWYWRQRANGFIGNLTNISKDILCTLVDLNNQSWGVNIYYDMTLKRGSGKEIYDYLKNNKDRFKMEFSPFFERIHSSIETKGWVDIENEYYNLLKKYSIEEFSRKDLDDLNMQLQFLQDWLIQYLNIINQTAVKTKKTILEKIYSPIDPKDVSIETFYKLRDYVDLCNKRNNSIREDKMLRYGKTFVSETIEEYKKQHDKFCFKTTPEPYMLPDEILLLSFNYTKTVHLYHNKNFTLSYIHGELEKPQDVIFGYGDEIDKNYQDLKNLNENACLRNMKTIKYLESDNYRNVLGFIDIAPYQVCIMGHSCGNSERTLLNTLFEHKNCFSIKPYYYIKEDGTDNYLELIQNISRNFTDMKLMRDRVVNKRYCEPLVSKK